MATTRQGVGDSRGSRGKPSKPTGDTLARTKPEGLGEAEPDGPLIVACGASAGGLEAFSQLLDALDTNVRASFVFVQHLAPDHESMLAALLQHHTKMPVADARDGVALEDGRIYVTPPATLIEIHDGSLRLSPRSPDVHGPGVIDHFFRSLAEHRPDRVVAIVLSGTGSDGAAGIREVRGAGGITMAQEPSSARYDGMPQAAIATGAVDVVLAPARLAQEIAHVANHPRDALISRASQADTDTDPARDEHLQRVFALLRAATGVDFRHYKLPTIQRRLQRRLVLHKLNRLEDYIQLLRQNSDEVHELYRDILIHVTRFFREPQSFQALTEHVFPRLLEDYKDDVPIRAWVAGCSTGEESYSLAIALLEAIGSRAGQIPVQIFATDVSEEAVQRARIGAYPGSIVQDVSPERLARFFTRSDGGYRVAKSVRDLCIFARQDVTRDPPFSRLDLIVCRNVLIYLNAPLQRRLMSVFHYALKPGRFLVLGHAETIGAHAELFQLEDRKHRIYAKRGIDSTAVGSFVVDHPATRTATLPTPVAARDGVRTVQNEVSRFLLDRFAPAGVVVDDDLQIVHFRGQTGPYLEAPSGDPSVYLYKMAREGLLHGLRTAITEARRSGHGATQEARVKQNDGWRNVSIEVHPIQAGKKRHFLVLFAPADESPPPAEPQAPSPSPPTPSQELSTNQRVHALEDELAASRSYLQSIIQELEAANEELQSANEEILSSNEELQSTNEELDTAKEELQSTNEELNTVNDELHGRNDELNRVNSDLVNILGSVQIAIVIVGSDLRIRRFTPMAERMLNLIETDIGRPIGDIKPNIDCPDLEQLIHETIDQVAPVERQVQDRLGAWFSLCIRPYKSVDNRIDGAVLSLFDINQLRLQENQLREMRHYAEAVVHMIRQPLVVLEPDLSVRTANLAFLSGFGLADTDIVGKPLLDTAAGAWNDPHLRRTLEALASGTDGSDRVEFDHEFPRVGRRRIIVEARRVEGPTGRPALILIALDETWPRANAGGGGS